MTRAYIEDSAQQLSMVTKISGNGLDVGSGRGTLALALAHRGISMTAVDLLPEMSRLTRENAAAEGVADLISTVTGDFRTAPLRHGGFDVIVVSAIPELTEDLLGLFVKFRGLLNAGGELVVMFMNDAALPKRWNSKRYKGHPRYRYIHSFSDVYSGAVSAGLVHDSSIYFEYRYLLSYWRPGIKLIRGKMFLEPLFESGFSKLARYTSSRKLLARVVVHRFVT